MTSYAHRILVPGSVSLCLGAATHFRLWIIQPRSAPAPDTVHQRLNAADAGLLAEFASYMASEFRCGTITGRCAVCAVWPCTARGLKDRALTSSTQCHFDLHRQCFGTTRQFTVAVAGCVCMSFCSARLLCAIGKTGLRHRRPLGQKGHM